MRRIPAAALLFALVTLVACGGGSDDDDATPTTAPVETAEPTPRALSDEIRSIDLESTQVLQEFVGEVGGTYVQDGVLYADLTEDNAEDAVVPLSSEGTLGDIAFIVLTLSGDGEVGALVRGVNRSYGISVRIEDGRLVTVEPVPGPDDPECCPSQLKTTVYALSGETLAVALQTTAPNPAGGAKTPSAEGN